MVAAPSSSANYPGKNYVIILAVQDKIFPQKNSRN
jgi:hypothetical protein